LTKITPTIWAHWGKEQEYIRKILSLAPQSYSVRGYREGHSHLRGNFPFLEGIFLYADVFDEDIN
jgi:hypothetical protein